MFCRVIPYYHFISIIFSLLFHQGGKRNRFVRSFPPCTPFTSQRLGARPKTPVGKRQESLRLSRLCLSAPLVEVLQSCSVIQSEKNFLKKFWSRRILDLTEDEVFVVGQMSISFHFLKESVRRRPHFSKKSFGRGPCLFF